MSDSIFEFSKKDLAFGKVYEPAWYTVRVANYYNEPSKNVEVPSTNHWFEGTILRNADTGDEKYAEHPIKWLFNSRAIGNAKGFLIGLGTSEESIEAGQRFDFRIAVGKIIDMHIVNDLYQGRQTNKVDNKFRVPRY